MEWVTQLAAKDIGGVAALLVIVGATITYVLRFIHTFTQKLEEQGAKQDEKIDKLEAEIVAKDDLLGKKNDEIWAKGERIARLRRLLIANGIELPPEEAP